MPPRARAPREGTPSGTERANSARPAEDAPPCALPPRRRSRRGLGSHSRPSGASDAAAPPSQRCSARPAAPAGMTPRTARVVDNLPMREILSSRAAKKTSACACGASQRSNAAPQVVYGTCRAHGAPRRHHTRAVRRPTRGVGRGRCPVLTPGLAVANPAAPQGATSRMDARQKGCGSMRGGLAARRGAPRRQAPHGALSE